MVHRGLACFAAFPETARRLRDGDPCIQFCKRDARDEALTMLIDGNMAVGSDFKV